MRIGFYGAGAIAQAIAGHAVRGGHEVLLSNRSGPETLAGVVEDLGPTARAGTSGDAAECDLGVLAVPWSAVAPLASELPDLDGQIVIDTTNQVLLGASTPRVVHLGEFTGSELVAALLPGARVVKAFNTLYARYIAPDPAHAAGHQLLFLAGDDPEAVAEVSTVTAGWGFAPVELGSLRQGGPLMEVGGPLSALHALVQDRGAPPPFPH